MGSIIFPVMGHLWYTRRPMLNFPLEVDDPEKDHLSSRCLMY